MKFTFEVPVLNIHHPKMRLVPILAGPVLNKLGARFLESKLSFETSSVRMTIEAPSGLREAEAIGLLQAAFDAASGTPSDDVN